MKSISKLALAIFYVIAIITLGLVYLHGQNIAVLNPKGIIALQQRDLMFTATALMLVVVLPVYALTFIIAYRYRAGNTKATYKPEWDHSRILEFTWWAVPSVIIGIL